MEQKGKPSQKMLEEIDRVSEAFFRYKNKLMEKKYYESQSKMTPTKYQMLKIIRENKNCIVADIVKKLELSSGATTLILNKLEEEQLITRKRCEKDRRIVFLKITEQGEEIYQRITDSRNTFYSLTLSPLTDEEKKEFLRMLKKIAIHLEDQTP